MSLLTSDVLNKATTFVIYLLVARYHGPRAFGQLSLGLMLFYVFQVFATAGLPTIVTRAIAQHSGRTDRYCANGLAAGALAGILSMLALFALAFSMRYDRDTTRLICLLGLGVAPYGMAIILESVFRGRECMHYIAIANVFSNTVKVVGAAALLTYGFDVMAIAVLLVGIRWLILVVEFSFYWKFLQVKRLRIQFRFVKRILLRSFTFLGIDAIIASWSSVNTLLLSKLATEYEVGLFSAACQILQPMALVNRSAVAALFPAMCKSYAMNSAGLRRITSWLAAFLAFFSIPVVVLLVSFAGPVVNLFYGGKDMQQAVPLIKVIASTLVIQSITSVFGNALWAAGRERTVLRIVSFNLVANIVVGFLLIRFYGLVGAAYTYLLISVLNGVQHWYSSNQFLQSSPLDRTVLAPLAAGAMMCLPIVFLASSDPITAAVVSIFVYVACMGLFAMCCEHGSLRNLPARVFAPLIDL
ncbi:colanic acid exporter [Novipirellula artificiosorum]|uniref:Colanic acid exporter n=2 Tax=Novipirellula artificiosorum TaxID=2528016 RepID=A0A5C6DJ60_9BACT|nr:colanic acid exporter [Novipirellula artificiosorum]